MTPPPLTATRIRPLSIIAVGISCLILFVLRLISSMSSLVVTVFFSLGDVFEDISTSTFVAYGICWLLDLLFSVALLLCGIYLLGTTRNIAKWFYLTVWGQLSLFLIIPLLMGITQAGESGMALGLTITTPLLLQCFTLFPIWSSMLVYRYYHRGDCQ